ncbi:MAG: hypothetical protein ACWA5P_05870 [bacterium]
MKMVSYERTAEGPLSEDQQKLVDTIDDSSVTVNVETTKTHEAGDGSGRVVPIETFGGNEATGETIDGKSEINATQHVNTESTQKVDEVINSPGNTILHAVTEAHEGAKMSQNEGHSKVGGAPFLENAFGNFSFAMYRAAHKKAVQSKAKITATPNSDGSLTFKANGVPIITIPKN